MMLRLFLLTLILMLSGIQQALASSSHLHYVVNYPDYALHLGHTRTDIALENSAVRTELRQSFLGVSVAEDITHWLKIRLSGGNAGYTLDGAQQGDQFEPTGAFLSLAFEPYFRLSERTGLAGNVAYRHVSVDDEINNKELEYRLNQIEFEATGVIHLHPTFTLELGANAVLIEGRERFITTSGTTSTDFEETDNSSIVVRGIFHAGNNGHVGLTAMGGAQNSFWVYFKYAY